MQSIENQLQKGVWSYTEKGLLCILGFLTIKLCKTAVAGKNCEGRIVKEQS